MIDFIYGWVGGNVSEEKEMNESIKSRMPAKGDILETIERERYDKPKECIDALLNLIKILASALYPVYEEDDE